ncbi:MAG: hypothetical protein A3J28_05635 [Acidobacteria bacterium RIFCSPLOWO2_12_FULL_60_22]|nr:MAG: hypothetical protein A3J28_05635 [Acidobacteria bacterium RIFCSPLOWO2_12_FULL_60_22]
MKAPKDYARECYQAGVIAVGWSRVGDLNHIATRGQLKRKLERTEDENPKTIAQWAGALWNFRNKVSQADIVICPDRDSRRYYIGQVLSRRVFHDTSSLGGGCSFAHRRKVRWLRVVNPEEATVLWPSGRFGGIQTVSEIKRGEDIIKIKTLLRRTRKTFTARPRLPIRPDMEWGRAAEERAMKWLRERGYKPQDVTRLNKGWDITCGDDRFEVKGRKSHSVAVRLSQNEWNAARHLKAKYTLLIFTAPTLEKLRRSVPDQIPDPTRTEVWSRRVTYEYILAQ